MWVVPLAAIAAFLGAAAGTVAGLAIAVRVYLPQVRKAMERPPYNHGGPIPAWAPAPVEQAYPDAVIVSGAKFSRSRRSTRSQ